MSVPKQIFSYSIKSNIKNSKIVYIIHVSDKYKEGDINASWCLSMWISSLKDMSKDIVSGYDLKELTRFMND